MVRKSTFFVHYITLLLVVFLSTGNLSAQTAFTCSDGVSYQIRGNPSELYSVNIRSGSATLLLNAAALGNRNLTGLGYNVNDNYLYANISNTKDIVKIGSDGISVINVPGLTADAYTAGDVSPDGNLYLYKASSTTIQKVNLSTLAVSAVTLTTGANLQDFSISPDGKKIYGMSNGNGNLASYDISGGALTSTDVGSATAVSASTFMDKTGDLFFISDATSATYEISGPGFPTGTSISRLSPNTSVAITNTDGARCVKSSATTQPAFDCLPNEAFISTSAKLISDNNCDLTQGKSTLIDYNIGTGSIISTSPQLIQAFNNERTTINALGFNVADHYLWAYRFGTNQLVRIGRDNSVDFFAIPGLSTNCLVAAGSIDNTVLGTGDIDNAGIMYLMNGLYGDRIIRIDLNPTSPTYLTKLSEVLLTPINPGKGTLSPIADFAINPRDGLLYTVSKNNNLIRINPTTGIVTNVGALTGISAPPDNYVVTYFDNIGTLYIQAAQSISIIKVPDVASGGLAASVAGTGTSLAGGDGARCPLTAIAPKLFSLSGHVFDDGSGLKDSGGALVNTSGAHALNPVDGATGVGTQLYVVLMTSDSVVLGRTPVSGTGSYRFDDLAPGKYLTFLTTGANASKPAPTTLPDGWQHTGEQVGVTAGMPDGKVDGIVAGITLTDADVTNANFGINQVPVADPYSFDIGNTPPEGTSITLNGTYAGASAKPTRLTGKDLEDGQYKDGVSTTIVIKSLPVPTSGTATGGQPVLSYKDIPVTVGQVIPNYDPSLLKVMLSGKGYMGIRFDYSVVDAAGAVSPPATYTIVFSSALPVTLVSFSVTLSGSVPVLNWVTASEINFAGFRIERSQDLKTWSSVSFIRSEGNTFQQRKYQFADADATNGIFYYRIRLVDTDNSFSYSHIVATSAILNKGSSQAYPNPASGRLFFSNIKAGEEALVVSGQVFTRDGRWVNNFTAEGLAANGLDIKHLPSGHYLARLSMVNGVVHVYRFVVAH